MSIGHVEIWISDTFILFIHKAHLCAVTFVRSKQFFSLHIFIQFVCHRSKFQENLCVTLIYVSDCCKITYSSHFYVFVLFFAKQLSNGRIRMMHGSWQSFFSINIEILILFILKVQEIRIIYLLFITKV